MHPHPHRQIAGQLPPQRGCRAGGPGLRFSVLCRLSLSMARLATSSAHRLRPVGERLSMFDRPLRHGLGCLSGGPAALRVAPQTARRQFAPASSDAVPFRRQQTNVLRPQRMRQCRGPGAYGCAGLSRTDSFDKGLRVTTERDLEIVAAGHTCLDLIPAFTIDGKVDKMTDVLVPGKMINMGKCVVVGGGPVTNAGVSIRRLGVKTELIGKIGNDDFGKQILNWYETKEGHFQGIKTVKGESTSYTIAICIPGVDRFYLHHCGANDTFGYDDVDFSLIERSKLM